MIENYETACDVWALNLGLAFFSPTVTSILLRAHARHLAEGATFFVHHEMKADHQ